MPVYSAVVACGCSLDYREEVATESIALSKSDDARLKKSNDLSFVRDAASSLLPALFKCRGEIRESNDTVYSVRSKERPRTACASENIM
jgi:hypothetical protein